MIDESVVVRVLGRVDNVIVVLIALGSGIAVPWLGSVTELLITPIVMGLMYGSVRNLDLRVSIFKGSGRPVLLAIGISHLVVPAVGFALGSRLLTPPELIGFAIVLTAPTTAGSAIVWTRLSEGTGRLAALIALASVTLSPVFTPLLLSSLLGYTVAFPYSTVLGGLAGIVGGGVGLSVVVPRSAIGEGVIDLGSKLAIGILVYTGVATAGLGRVEFRLVAVVALLTVAVLAIGFAVGLVLGRTDRGSRPDSLAIGFTGTLKNLGVSLYVANALALPSVVLPIVVYYVGQEVFGAIVSDVV